VSSPAGPSSTCVTLVQQISDGQIQAPVTSCYAVSATNTVSPPSTTSDVVQFTGAAYKNVGNLAGLALAGAVAVMAL